MGLSNEERTRGLYNCINRLNTLNKEWKNFSAIEKHPVQTHLEKLWPTFLAGQRNGMHWIIGSASDNPITSSEASDPWTIALTQNLEAAGRKVAEEKGESMFATLNDRDRPFDPVRHLSLQSFLHYSYDPCHPYVYETYQVTESMIYYLRRYDDEFRGGLSRIDEIIGRIQGECYAEFSSNDIFAKAYLSHEIVKLLYGDGYLYKEDNRDVLQKLMMEDHAHHDLSDIVKKPIDELAKFHVSLVNEPTLLNRILSLLQLANGKFLYEYGHTTKKWEETFKNKCAEHGEEISKVMNAQRNRYIDSKKEKSGINYDHNPLNAYGFSAYDLMKDNGKGSINLDNIGEDPKEE